MLSGLVRRRSARRHQAEKHDPRGRVSAVKPDARSSGRSGCAPARARRPHTDARALRHGSPLSPLISTTLDTIIPRLRFGIPEPVKTKMVSYPSCPACAGRASS